MKPKLPTIHLMIIVLSGLLIYVSIQLQLEKRRTIKDRILFENQQRAYGEIQYIYSLMINQLSLERMSIDSSIQISKYDRDQINQVDWEKQLEGKIIIWIPKDACLTCTKKLISITKQLKNNSPLSKSISFIFETESIDNFSLDALIKIPINSFLVNQPIIRSSVISNDIIIFFFDSEYKAKSVFFPVVEYENEVLNYFKFLDKFYF